MCVVVLTVLKMVVPVVVVTLNLVVHLMGRKQFHIVVLNIPVVVVVVPHAVLVYLMVVTVVLV